VRGCSTGVRVSSLGGGGRVPSCQRRRSKCESGYEELDMVWLWS